MNIFGGRPGIAAGVLAVIAILSAAFLTLTFNILLAAAILLMLVVCIVLLILKKVKPYRVFSIAVVTAVVLFAWGRGMNIFYNISPKAEALCGENSYVHATVAERHSSGDYYSYYIVKLKSINGEKIEEKAWLSCEYNSDLQVGYEFVLRAAEVSYVMTLTENEAVSFLADKIFLCIVSFEETDCHILSEGNYTFSDRLDSLNSYLCAKLKFDVGGDGGRLASAMLLGDKEALTSEMYRDFRRAGISHYLAVSGLHVSIITAIVSLFLINLKIKRVVRNFLLFVFAVGYLFLLGFPVSAVRSVAMLTVTFLAYSMGDESDILNSLGIAASLIVLLSPTAVFDESFILSFFATLGIAAFMPVFMMLPRKLSLNKKTEGSKKEKSRSIKCLRRFLWATLSLIMTTLCASASTLLVIAYLFGETSSLSLAANLAVAPVGAPLLASSLLYLILGEVPYLGDALLCAIRFCSKMILNAAAYFSDMEDVVISLVSKGAWCVIIVFSTVLIVSLVIKIKHKTALLVITLLYPLVLFSIASLATAALPETVELTCYGTGEDENIFLQYEDENVIIDVSDGSYSKLCSIANIAKASGVTEFDTVVLTHYHNRHVSAISRFTAEEKVRSVILPYPSTVDEAWIMVQLADVIEKAGCSVRVLEPDQTVNLIGNLFMTYSRITRIERSDHPVIYFSFFNGKERLTYLSSSSWEDGLPFEDELNRIVSESEIVLIGGHGPVNKEAFDIPLPTVENVYVFSKDVGYILHPESVVPTDRAVVNVQLAKFAFELNE